MDYELNGLPLHILLIHATVVFVPLAAFLTLIGMFWPTFRRKLGIITPIVALVALILTPITQQAGSWLIERINPTPEVLQHASFGNRLLPWVLGVFLAALGQWIWVRVASQSEKTNESGEKTNPHRPHTSLQWALWAVSALIVSFIYVQTVVLIVQIGESGSRAVWEGTYRSS